MPFSLIHRPDPQDVALAPARFDAPGGTIGRCAGNTLVLPDAREQVGRLQAVLRLQAGTATLQTLAGSCPVAVNGELLAPDARRGLHDGDEVAIGRFNLVVRDEPAMKLASVASVEAAAVAAVTTAPLVMPARALDEDLLALPSEATMGLVPQSTVQPTEDVFADLIGPGTLPVGSTPDMSCHPFDMASAAPRNAADPLALVPQAQPENRQPIDPLALFGQDDDAHDVFSDRSPSALDARRPGVPRAGIISDALAVETGRDAASAHDHAQQLGGYMRPASVAETAGAASPLHSNRKAKSP